MINFGRKVSLGTLDGAHKEKIRGWRNDPLVSRYNRQIGLISEAHHSSWFDNLENNKCVLMYGVFAHSPEAGVPNELVGVCGLTGINYIHQRAEFSLYICPKRQRHGLGKPALETLLDHGFQDLNLHKIEGECLRPNHAMKMFLKMGFHHEGTKRGHYYKAGKFWDADIFSILRSEWGC